MAWCHFHNAPVSVCASAHREASAAASWDDLEAELGIAIVAILHGPRDHLLCGNDDVRHAALRMDRVALERGVAAHELGGIVAGELLVHAIVHGLA